MGIPCPQYFSFSVSELAVPSFHSHHICNLLSWFVCCVWSFTGFQKVSWLSPKIKKHPELNSTIVCLGLQSLV